MAVVVDPLDQYAVNFIGNINLSTLADSGRMFLPIRTIRSLNLAPDLGYARLLLFNAVRTYS